MTATHIQGPLILEGQGGSSPSPLLFGIGTAADPATTSTASKKFIEFRTESSATSGDSRLAYLRHYLSGAGGGGEALRAFTTVNDVAGATAHGAHISLNFGTSGTLTGLGVAGRNTLHIPDDGTQAGTLAAIQAEIYSDGTNSDTNGATEVSFLRVVNDGDSNGKDNVDDDAFLASLQGFTAGSGHLVDNSDGTAGTTLVFSNVAKLKIKIGSTTYYIPVAQTISVST
jgi:hypothetical protein